MNSSTKKLTCDKPHVTHATHNARAAVFTSICGIALFMSNLLAVQVTEVHDFCVGAHCFTSVRVVTVSFAFVGSAHDGCAHVLVGACVTSPSVAISQASNCDCQHKKNLTAKHTLKKSQPPFKISFASKHMLQEPPATTGHTTSHPSRLSLLALSLLAAHMMAVCMSLLEHVSQVHQLPSVKQHSSFATKT